MNRKPVFWRVGFALIVTAAIGAMTLFVTTKTGSAGQPPPGLTAGVSALQGLPAEGNLPAEVLEILRAFDPSIIGPVHQAAARTRKLRSNAGATKADIYAVRSRTGSVCVMVAHYSGVCPASLETGQPGLLFTLGGGYGTAEFPPVLAGVAADNVSGIELTANGQSIPVTVENNGVFAKLPTGMRSARIVIHYDGFEEQIFELPTLGVGS